ncbi:MAG: InlB B-repeat-containing protein, partial [Mobilitalea sp.]
LNGFDIDLSAVGRGYVELNSQAYYYSSAIVSFNGSSESYLQVNAIPQEGAQFIYWTRLGVILDNDIYPETIDDFSDFTDINLVAHFTDESIPEVSPIPSPIPSSVPSPTPVPTSAPSPIKYTVISPYVVNFDLQGGTLIGGGADRQFIFKGNAAVEPKVTRYGYTFLGWDDTFDNITKDMTIKAQWEADAIFHTVTFDLFGGTHTGGGELIQEVKEGGEAIEPTATLEGYSLVDWDMDFYDVLEDMTITADWKENATTLEQLKFSISYDANGGEG